MSEDLSKYDIAALIALVDMIRINWSEQPEMYRLLLSFLADYNPAVKGNKERVNVFLNQNDSFLFGTDDEKIFCIYICLYILFNTHVCMSF